MSIMAAQRMGLRCVSLDTSPDSPAGQVADSIVGSLDDPEAIAKLLDVSHRVTWDSEFIPVKAVRDAGADPRSLVPGLDVLETVQDKLRQREMYEHASVPGPRARAVANGRDLDDVARDFGLPFVIKSRFGGYDGKGTRTIRSQVDIEAARPLVDRDPWMAEEFVPFKREVAVMVCRSASETLCFPTMETVQVDHVCDLVFPAGVDASATAVSAVESLGGFGLFGVELFELESGTFMVNETAPRPHNTGHYTLDWGGVSQFEQHVRLVVGLPLSPISGPEACMANLLGQPESADWRDGLSAALAAVPDAHVHWYGKSQAKPGRKMGHINVMGPGCVERAQQARRAFYDAWTRT